MNTTTSTASTTTPTAPRAAAEGTRADRIRDGALHDVSETAREAGFTVPVAITDSVRTRCVEWTEEDARRRPATLQEPEGRLWDVLWMAACKARQLEGDGRRHYTTPYQLIVVPRPGNGRRRLQTLKLVVGDTGTGRTAATIMLPEEG